MWSATVEKPTSAAIGGFVKGFIKDKLGSTGKVLVDPVGNLRGGADGAMKGSTSSTAKKSLKAALGGLVIMGIVLGVMVFRVAVLGLYQGVSVLRVCVWGVFVPGRDFVCTVRYYNERGGGDV